jgi:hypothetical protein
MMHHFYQPLNLDLFNVRTWKHMNANKGNRTPVRSYIHTHIHETKCGDWYHISQRCREDSSMVGAVL